MPKERWPSNSLWTFIVDLWHPNPWFRPQALMVARSLERAEFTLPPLALRRIIEFAAINYSDGYWGARWIERTGILHTLSLVSRACWLITNPILYRDILLYQSSLGSSEQLIYALNSSCMQPLRINTPVLVATFAHYCWRIQAIRRTSQRFFVDLGSCSKCPQAYNRPSSMTRRFNFCRPLQVNHQPPWGFGGYVAHRLHGISPFSKSFPTFSS